MLFCQVDCLNCHVIRHHNAYFVFGHPGDNSTQPLYKERLERHFKYVKLYDGIMWMIEGLENKWKIYKWG